MDDYTKALQQIEERRSQYDRGFLTKDADPANFTKADPDSGILEGDITQYWVVDSYGEATAPGAFTKSITDRGPNGANRIVLRYEHETTIGVMREMQETDTGVSVQAFVSDDTGAGSVVRRHLKDGIPYGMSIGFNRIASRPAAEDDPLIWDHAPKYIRELAMDNISQITVLTEVRNVENSVVTFPAVDNALVTNYRSTIDLSAKAIDRLMTDLKAGRLSDDHLDQLRRLFAEMPAASDPIGEMPESVTNQTADQRRNYIAELNLALYEAGITLEGHLL